MTKKKSSAKKAASPGTEKRQTAKAPAHKSADSKKSAKKSPRVGPVVVGIGASAGGLEALKRLFRSLPPQSGVAFVVVQHLDPTHESLMAELLSKYTTMPVLQVTNATPIEPDHVYMIPPNRFIKVQNGGLFLDDPITKRGVRLPIDYFFRSMAESQKERSVGIILSGTGSDGADGLRELKAAGGMTVVQAPDSAEYDGMPRAAIATGSVDFVLPIEDMAGIIVPYAQHPYVQSKPKVNLADTAPDHYRAILSLLRAHTDQDFSHYKTGTLTRRIERRMGIRHIDSAAKYLELLRSDHDEVLALFKDMLIGVTRFFREPKVWENLADIVTRRILEKQNEEPMRLWVPGCASGEEAYSLAMLLFEQQDRQNRRLDLQIFATDIDTEAINVARLGVYPEGAAADITEARIERFFSREGDKLRVKKKLRESCIFAVQNLLSDPPFSNLDIVSCRNLLIYLEPEIQQKVFDMFHFSLKHDGLLVLGSSESPTKRKRLFQAVSQSSRIYTKVGESRPGQSGYPLSGSSTRKSRGQVRAERPELGNLGTVEISKKALLDEFAPASVVVNSRGMIHYIHGPIGNYLGLPSGEPELNVGDMAQTGLKAKVRTVLHQAQSASEPISTLAPRVQRNGGSVSVRVSVRSLPSVKNVEPLFLVSFQDESQPEQSPADDPSADGRENGGEQEGTGDLTDRQLALELQATREDLQSTIEELESANEELKASNEEVMSMNEELQSTNEELETSREELQSLNEELSTVNNQLHDKVEELESTTNDLTNLLASTDMATIFLDSDLRIRRFTPATIRLMNLLDSDVGRPIDDLSPRVNDPDLVADARTVLDRLSPIEKEVQNGGGHCYVRRITPFRTSDNKIEGIVVTFNDVTSLTESRSKLETRERQQAVIADLGRAGLAGLGLQKLMDQAARQILETLDVEYSKFLHMTPDRKRMKLVAGQGWKRGIVGKATVGIGIESQAGFTLQSASPIIVRDLNKEKRFSGPKLLTDHGVVSGMSVIIGPEEQPWGVLGVHSKRRIDFTVDDTHFLQAVANVIWEAIRRKSIERQLRENDNRTSAFLRNSAVIAWVKDEEGRHVYLSETYERQFEVSLKDWLGKTDFEVWPPEIAERFVENDKQVLETQQRMEFVEKAAFPNGADVYFFVSKFPFQDEEGKRYVGGLGVDITQQRQFEEELKEARRIAEGANQAKSQFLANVSHEIRTPMTAILGYADILHAHLKDPDNQACVKTIKENGAYLCEILNDILDLSKIEAGKFPVNRQDCDVVSVIADVRSLMAVRANESDLEFSVEFDGQIPQTIQTDPKMVRQVLVNLVGNAIKFTEEGGVRIVARCNREEQKMIISVIDTGIGIDKEHLEMLFEPFEQVDTSSTRIIGGSGLGLAISRNLAEMLEGRIEVESAKGEGSTFRFLFATGTLDNVKWTMPDPKLLQERQRIAPEGKLPRISGRVLAIDDRREMHLLVQSFVESAGGEVITALDGAQGVKLWLRSRDAGPPIDAILMDMQMPVMDGLEATRRLREEGYQGPIIALTANAMQADQEKCLEAGCDDFITKPINKPELLEKLAEKIGTKAEPGDGRSLKILYVDDNASILRLQKMLFERHGHQVQTASRASKALQIVKEFHPDAVVLDLGLPGISGDELLAEMKQTLDSESVLFICVSGRAESDVPWREMGFDHYLQKPTEPEDLNRILATKGAASE